MSFFIQDNYSHQQKPHLAYKRLSKTVVMGGKEDILDKRKNNSKITENKL